MTNNFCIAAALGVALLAARQAQAQVPPQEKIDKAIDTGCAFLLLLPAAASTHL